MSKRTTRIYLWRLLWLVFFLAVIQGAVEILARIADVPMRHSGWLAFSRCALVSLLTVLHAGYTLGLRRGLGFYAISMMIGFFAEQIGMHSGFLFGGHYVYRPYTLQFAGVPVDVLCYWAAFVYLGYSFSNSLLLGLGFDKPANRRSNAAAVLGLAVLDGAVVVLLDLLLDPLASRLGLWQWNSRGIHYAVPVGNFAGWFGVVSLTTGMFRALEYVQPSRGSCPNIALHMIPVTGYLTLGVFLAAWAEQAGMPGLSRSFGSAMLFLAVAAFALLVRAWRGSAVRRPDAGWWGQMLSQTENPPKQRPAIGRPML